MKVIQLGLFLTVLGCAWCQDEDEPYVEVGITQKHAHPGENITFECRVTNQGSNIVTISKSVVLSTTETLTEQISSNHVLLPPYDSTGRHLMRFNGPFGDITLIYLTISLVDVEDTARYTCMVMNSEALASVNFEVYDIPDEVIFDNFTDGDNITLQEEESVEIRCHAIGVVPLPTMHMTVGSRDVTDQFHEKHGVEARCPPTDGKKKTCLLHYQFNKQAYSKRFIPTYRDNGKNLTCNVTLSQSRLPGKTANIALNVLHEPKIECEQNAYTVATHHLEMKCNVSYNPDLTSLYLSAIDDIKIEPGSKIEGIRFSYFVVNKYMSEVTITIDSVMHKHFGDYNIYAENNKASNNFQIKVLRDKDHIVGGVSRLHSSSRMLLISTIFTLIIFKYRRLLL